MELYPGCKILVDVNPKDPCNCLVLVGGLES